MTVHQAHSVFLFCLMLQHTVFLNLLLNHCSTVQSFPAGLKDTALQADDCLSPGRSVQRIQAALVLGF